MESVPLLVCSCAVVVAIALGWLALQPKQSMGFGMRRWRDDVYYRQFLATMSNEEQELHSSLGEMDQYQQFMQWCAKDVLNQTM